MERAAKYAAPPLGFTSLLALGINGIVGVGIFFAPREVATAVPGWRGVAVYLCVALLLLPTGLAYARLGRAFPADGGPYLYAREAFGGKAAFAVGFTTYVSALFSTSTVLVGLVENATATTGIVDGGARLAVELSLLTLLSGALSLGLRLSAVAWSAVTFLKAMPLVALPIAALWVTLSPGGDGLTGNDAIAPAAPMGVLTAALPVLFALQGFEVVPLPAAQVKRPERSVPLATVGALVFAALLYMALHAACVHALPDLSRHELPLADAARVYGGVAFSRLVGGATSLSALGIVIGMLAMTPRYLAPLGQSDALGFGLDRLSPRAVPLRAFAVTYVLVFAILVANARWGSIRHLLALSSLSVTLQYTVTAAALFVLATREAAGLRRWERWPAPFALLSFVLFLMGSSRLEVPVLVAMIALGFLVRAIGRLKRVAAR
ncbi:MAG TPA: APC family permease [Polyangiaceae bacterium]|nr:APC family permease [Polyangiaceae bacterium]